VFCLARGVRLRRASVYSSTGPVARIWRRSLECGSRVRGDPANQEGPCWMLYRVPLPSPSFIDGPTFPVSFQAAYVTPGRQGVAARGFRFCLRDRAPLRGWFWQLVFLLDYLCYATPTGR